MNECFCGPHETCHLCMEYGRPAGRPYLGPSPDERVSSFMPSIPIDDDDPRVTLTVTMTPEQYVKLKKDAEWEGCSVGTYLVRNAMGMTRRGC